MIIDGEFNLAVPADGEAALSVPFDGEGSIAIGGGGGIQPSGEIPITANGNYNVAQYATADVDVQPTLQSGSGAPKTVARTFTPAAGYDGFSDFTIGAVKTETLNATENGRYTPPLGSYFSEVNINVSAPVTSVNNMTGDVVLNAADVGAQAEWTEVTVATDGAVTQALDAGKVYHFTGALTSLTIALNAASSGLAHYHFDFLSGTTAPTLTMPSGVTMPDSFAVEASKRYEVDVLNNYGAVMAWANS